MIDRFGNTLKEGDCVVYFSSGYTAVPGVGILLGYTEGKGACVLSEKNHKIHRPSRALILYNGIDPYAATRRLQ